jgi:hypothetical protein
MGIFPLAIPFTLPYRHLFTYLVWHRHTMKTEGNVLKVWNRGHELYQVIFSSFSKLFTLLLSQALTFLLCFLFSLTYTNPKIGWNPPTDFTTFSCCLCTVLTHRHPGALKVEILGQSMLKCPITHSSKDPNYENILQISDLAVSQNCD